MDLTKEKKVVESLRNQKSNYTSPESAQDQANSLEALSTDIYTDSKRFIYELLQNADDASSSSGILEVQILIESNRMIVSHNGEHFSEIDIESICSVGDGNKKGDENKTGFKGIGFKSVFSHSGNVMINTGKYCFRFDKSYWDNHWDEKWGNRENWKNQRKEKGKNVNVKMPWQIIPIPDQLPIELDHLNSFNVSTDIQYDDTSSLEQELFTLFSNTQILLFLRSKRARIEIKGKNTKVIEKIQEDEVTVLKEDGKNLSEWLLKTFQFEVTNETKNHIENDVRIPKKLRTSSKTEISFAVQLEQGGIKVPDKANRFIFTYLPTSVNYNFPFLINASFLTDAGRQHLHEDLYWNGWLFEQIPLLFFKWLSELAITNYKNQIFRLIPSKVSGFSNLAQSFNRGFTKAVAETAFIPNFSGRLLKAGEAVFDKTRISEFIDSGVLIQFINLSKNKSYASDALIPYYEPLSKLSGIGVHIFEVEDLKHFIGSEIFQSNHKRKENFKLISFLQEQSSNKEEGEEKYLWDQSLRKTAFIFDEQKQLRTPKEIYFPEVDLSEEFDSHISIIHPKTYDDIENHKRIKKWLKYLGVKQPSRVSFIEKSILGNDEYITLDNAIEVGRLIFDTYKEGKLTDEHLRQLKQAKFLTQDKTLKVASSLFLSDKFKPELSLESFYEYDFYVSCNYVSTSDLISEWKTFFLKIGVSESIESRNIGTVSKNKLENVGISMEYFDQGVEKAKSLPNYKKFSISYISNLRKITFIEIANNYNFSILFWKQLFNKNLVNFSNTPHMPMGYWNGYCDLENYNKWAFENLPIFPCKDKKCHYLSNVFLYTNENYQLAGNYFPIFDYEDEIPQHWLHILTFKNSINLDDCLLILTLISKDLLIDEDLKKENKRRIELIYKKLSNNFLGYSSKLSNWAKENKLLAKDGNFYSPVELSLVTVEGFRAANLAYCDEKDEKQIELLRILGVRIIDNVIPDIPNSNIEIKGLKRQLEYILPLIALVSIGKSRKKKEWAADFDRLKKKLSQLRFFETTEIYLSYGNEEDKQKRSSYSDGNDFYYVGNWYKPRILDGLVEPLSKFLGIKNAYRFLSVILLDDYDEGIEYLKEKFGDSLIDLLPQEYLTVPKEVSTSNSPNAGNRPYNQSDEDLGHKGELFVFDELKQIYTEKYGESIVETDTGFEINDKVKVIWRNKTNRTSFNHDFKVVENNNVIYIDSKATPYSEDVEKVAFYLSPNEFSLMESSEIYFIARVFQVTTSPYLKFIRMNVEDLI